MYAGVQFNQWIVRSEDSGQTFDHIGFAGNGNAPFMDPLVEEPGTGALLTGAHDKVWRLDDPKDVPGFSTTPGRRSRRNSTGTRV